MPVLVLLLFGAGLFVQIPSISAQDAQPDTSSPDVSAQDEATTAQRMLEIESNYLMQEESETTPAAAAASGPSIWSVVRMLLTLAIVAAAIYGLVYFFKRTAKPAAEKDPFLKILATAHLGSNRYAHIVNVGDKAWLLGSGDGGVNLIGEIDNKDLINAMMLEESKNSAQVSAGRFPDFLSMLRRLGVRAETQVSGADDIRKRRERLKGL